MERLTAVLDATGGLVYGALQTGSFVMFMQVGHANHNLSSSIC